MTSTSIDSLRRRRQKKYIKPNMAAQNTKSRKARENKPADNVSMRLV